MSHSIERARRDLGRRLREERRSAELTGARLAELLSWSQPKVSKIETGRQAPNAAEIVAWTQACGRPQLAEDLVARLNDLESMWVEWKDQLHNGLSGIQSRMVTEEEQVRVFRVFEPLIIPGLLQTPGYARAVMEAANRKNRTPSFGIEDALHQRIRRQELLYRRGKRFCFILSEAALHQRRGNSETMAAQIDRLVTVSDLSNVSLGIIPFDSSPPYLPLHGFWIQDESSVVIETVSAELTLTHRSEIEQYTHVFTMASSGARFHGQARALLRRAAPRTSSR
ncbi:helix-turn-helix domain-containing protein [Nocardiopsis kunsanensis]|uniref:helix-turn-helix domain-containing protein n=1 Tax=Nocardiopsis kunsanensis TaxID=141693 RepID=UPI0003485C99|nr:helix-turn-helix transcriptional regulator [Nocardiopsis kunsanensis]